MHRLFSLPAASSMLCTAALTFLASLTPAASAQDLSSPRAAWATLEAAYQNKDMETIIASRDYLAEAGKTIRLLAEADIAAIKAKEPNFLQIMAQQTIDKVRQEQRDNTGYPLRGNPACRITGEKQIEPDIIELQQHCLSQKGVELTPKLYFIQKQGKWRLFDVAWQ
jgi:hypothetical protein